MFSVDRFRSGCAKPVPKSVLPGDSEDAPSAPVPGGVITLNPILRHLWPTAGNARPVPSVSFPRGSQLLMGAGLTADQAERWRELVPTKVSGAHAADNSACHLVVFYLLDATDPNGRVSLPHEMMFRRKDSMSRHTDLRGAFRKPFVDGPRPFAPSVQPTAWRVVPSWDSARMCAVGQ